MKDSKLCQLEQINFKKRQIDATNDMEKAWHEIQHSFHNQRTMQEMFIDNCRRQDGLCNQIFLKNQMADKIERSHHVFDQINEERKLHSKICKEEHDKEQARLKQENLARQLIGDTVKQQMQENRSRQKEKLERELKMDKVINEQIRTELSKRTNVETNDREQFRRDVFSYLDNLLENRQHNRKVESDKEKLIEDIRAKASEDEWHKRCEFHQKRKLVNKSARLGQFEQIQKNEHNIFLDILKQKQENHILNQRELLERQNIKEEELQRQNLKLIYGRELLEQHKTKQLQDFAQKQREDEQQKQATEEVEKFEKSGYEFVKSCQDVLLLHPNILIIQKAKHF